MGRLRRPSDRFHSVAHPPPASSVLADITAKEGIMGLWDNLPIGAALLLASVAALTSGSAEARRQVAGFVAEALSPQAADTGDLSYLLEPSTGTVWPLPPPRASGLPEDGQD
jgi:hypothetical protein